MDKEKLYLRLLAAEAAVKEAIDALQTTDHQLETAIHTAAAQHPTNLIPANTFYQALPGSRLQAAALLQHLGYTRVKKEQGIFWVKPAPATPPKPPAPAPAQPPTTNAPAAPPQP